MNDQAQKISDISKNGYQLLKENRVSDAVDCFSKILLIDECNNYALVGMGDASRKMGSVREAVRFYQRCLDHHPGNNYALFGLADCYKALNQYQKAIDIWELYLQHDDKNITVLTRIADAYRKVRDFANSKNTYLHVLEMEGSNPYAIIGLGHLHYDFKEYREALFYWEQMIGFSNGEKSANFQDNGIVDIRVLTSIGNCHRKLKTFSEGIPYFEAALQREKNNFYALFGLADCYRGMGQTENSLKYWNLILEHDPKNKMILTRTGDAYRNLNDMERAKLFYERALNIEFDTYAVMGLALLSRVNGKYEDAVTSFKRLIQQDNKNYRLYIELADCYLQMGDRRRAAQTLEEFQKLGTRNEKVTEMLESVAGYRQSENN
ncbi:MAG: tetratricopeptide repeat protein [Treponema sp.]|jgi:tetratricopeptide (TPR) repeat protein|nr:tetratricopeptide repeat protein [Treponema sp.]